MFDCKVCKLSVKLKQKEKHLESSKHVENKETFDENNRRAQEKDKKRKYVKK